MTLTQLEYTLAVAEKEFTIAAKMFCDTTNTKYAGTKIRR